MRVSGSTSIRIGSLGGGQLAVIRSVFNTLIAFKDTSNITPLGLSRFSCLWTEPVSFSVREVLGDVGRDSFGSSPGKRDLGGS